MRVRYFMLILLIPVLLLYLLSRRQRHAPTWLVMLPGLLAVGIMAIAVATQLDDAYIAFRFADNLAHGHGPVYNIGERVEGYTSPFWMLLSAGGILVGIAPPVLTAVLGIALLIVLFILLDRIVRQEGTSNVWVRGTLPIALGVSPAFVLWWFCGVEVPAYAVLLVLICWELSQWDGCDSRRLINAGALLALLILVRPDGFLMAGVGVGYVVLRLRKHSGLEMLKSTIRFLGPLVIVFAALTVWRVLYYGDWLPNTYYCKLGGDPLLRLQAGMRYLRDNVGYIGGTAPFLVATIAVGFARVRRFAALAAVTIAVYMAYFLYAGGDALQERFFVHITPLLYVTAWCGGIALAKRLAGEEKIQRRNAYLLGIALLVLLMSPLTLMPRYMWQRNLMHEFHYVAKLLADNVPGDFSLATTAAGIIPYRTNMPTIDMLGLCDKHIARCPAKCSLVGHQKWDAGYVVSRAPDIIVVSKKRSESPGELLQFPASVGDSYWHVFYEIYADSRFQQNYSRISVPLSGGKWFVFWGHNRRDWQSLFPNAIVRRIAAIHE